MSMTKERPGCRFADPGYGCNSLLENADLLRQLNGDLPRPVYARKRIRSATDPNQHYKRAVSSRKRGVGHRHERSDGMRWTRRGRARNARAGRVLRPVSSWAARRRTMLKPPLREASADGYQVRRKLWRRRLRTAKPCGPGTRCWCQVGGGFTNPTGFGKTIYPPMTNSSPGRARHKPLKPLRRKCRGWIQTVVATLQLRRLQWAFEGSDQHGRR
jgi:hypothetical protein